MKTITKSQYLYLKSKKNAELLKNETVTIEDEEYEDLIQYSNKQITPIDDGNDEPQEIYNIIFKDGNEIVRKITGPMGTYVSVPYVEKEGYEFLGWSLDGEKITMPVDGIYDSDITYIAVWKKIEQEDPIEPQEETYDYSGCDFGVNQWGYNIISLEDKTVSIYYCGNHNTLTEAIIPETVEYNNILFSVTSIGGRNYYEVSGVGAFEGCSILTSVNIPNSVTSISNNAFRGCSSLTSMNLPNSVTSISNNTFRGCTSLTNINIPNSVTSIGNGAFSGCTSLISINISNSITSIGSETFYGCTSLTSINIPNSVTSIGTGAFRGCTSLTSVNIPNSVTSISDYAFSGCSSLSGVTIPDSITTIGQDVFSDCSSLTSCTIGSGVTSISDYAFYDCNSLTSIDIPNSVTSIGHEAFYGCTSLISVNIPNSVTSISDYAFIGCSKLISITIYSSNINFFIYINYLNIDHQITIYVLPELVNDYKSHYEKDIFLGKVNILPIEE